MAKRAPQQCVLESFDEFWRVYPRKVAKGDARKAWAKLNPSPELVVQILRAVEWQSGTYDWRKDGGQWVPYPASWIRGERWEDEPLTVSAVKQPMQWYADCQAMHQGTCPSQAAHEFQVYKDRQRAAS